MTGDAPSLQDVLRQRQQHDFVGRDARLAEFSANLGYPPLDPRRRFIFSVHGVAGVGKTFLVQRFRRLAEAAGAACSYVDEDCFDAVETMAAIAADYGDQGIRMPGFEAQLATYRQRRHEMESDPQAPLGDLVTSASVKVGMSVAKSVPIAGAAAEVLDADAVAAQLNRLRAYLGQRFGRKADVDLLLKPVEVLTRAFVAALGEVAGERTAVLFFDTFERTGAFLEEWLLDLLGGKYGPLSANLVVVVSGQHPLSDNRWSAMRSLIAVHPLEPFTEQEARAFLAQRGVADPEVVQTIFALSGRVPMWLATLAENSPQESGGVRDPSEGAVDRFLKWEPDEDRKTVARLGALPRRVNRDVLAAVLGDAAQAEALFDWLCDLPFVSRSADHWKYHDAVRDAMLRLARATSPQQWRERHRRLADHFGAERAALDLSDEDGWEDESWQTLLLEEHYHGLCAAPQGALAAALEQAAIATRGGMSLARRWAAMLAAAGRAADSERLTGFADELTGLLQGDDDVAFLTALIDSGDLSRAATATAFTERGDSHRLAERFETAVDDLTRAIAIDPDSARAHRYRGMAYRELGRLDEALADFDRSIELDPGASWTYAQRSLAFKQRDDLERALADLDRAIGLQPDSDWALAERGSIYWLMNRLDEALAGFDRAVELDPNYYFAITMRAIVYRDLKRYDEALANFDRAVELSAENFWALTHRGMTYRMMRRFAESLADLDRAVALLPDDSLPFSQRGATYRLLERFQEALADLDRALELDPANEVALAERGATYLELDRFDEALADLDRAIAIDPRYIWALVQRGIAFRSSRQLDRAVDDLSAAVELAPRSDWALTERGGTFILMDRYEEALEDLSRAIELDPAYDLAFALRGKTYRILDRFEEALADFDRAVELDPEYWWAVAERGRVYRHMGRYSEAVADLSRTLEHLPDDDWSLAERGTAYRELGDFTASLADFDRAVELKPDHQWAVVQRGFVHLATGSYAEALADFDRGVALDPADDIALGHRGLVLALLGDYERARRDLDRVVELDPSASWWRFVKGCTAIRAGDSAEGLQEVRAALDLVAAEIADAPDEAVHRCNRIVYLVVTGDTAEARREFDALLTTAPEAHALADFVEDLEQAASVPGVDRALLEGLARDAATERRKTIGNH